MSVEARLKELDLILPEPPAPVAAYLPAVRTGNLVQVSGQLPFAGKTLMAQGPVPTKTPVDVAQSAARQCVLNALAHVNRLLGSLDHVTRVVRVGVFVQSADGFSDQPIVANGASELLVQIFGDIGKHARAAVGVNALPLDASVEIEFTFEVN
ncbi:RidA family protein [Planctomyces sp. SH-PL14]|uniref:RidA family protein n=1 Tax=Planctomyces sp. SH-PL14 TaxID=1632864 RepID=UPI00078C20D8|nr:RidA family protein [Planctomyces sp. SH-PL14]AMV16888.1 Endoribonuclease L-PSP [Planctomyces sp. SH-PL14]